MSMVNIIEGHPSYAEELSELATLSFTHTFRDIFNKQEDLSHYCANTYDPGKLAKSLDKADNRYFLAILEGKLIGYAKLKLNSDHTVELQKIYLHPQEKGRGLGTRLLEEVLQFCNNQSVQELFLYVVDANPKAIDFYTQKGFGISGEKSFTIGSQDFNFFRMTLDLIGEWPTEYSLDPDIYEPVKSLGRQMVEDMVTYHQDVPGRPSWRPIPLVAKEQFSRDLPHEGMSPEAIYEEFLHHILPYNKGNVHPRFFAWIQGTGTITGFFADMLASAMNPNVTIGEQIPMYVDQQVVDWCKEMLGFPKSASGILVSGGSMANITCLTVARNTKLGDDFREKGYAGMQKHPILYCSTEVHSCIFKAAEILGIGHVNVRTIPVNEYYEMVTSDLEATIKEDLDRGLFPMCVVATTGTVNSGAIDPLEEIYRICQQYDLWMHIDGAYGALAKLDNYYADRLKYIEYADSVAFDLHKWLYINYEVGCALIRNKENHRDAFAVTPNYLQRTDRGLAGGPDSYNNYGFELSRGFKALKVWMSIKEHGINKYKAIISQNDRQAEFLGRLIEDSPFLELVAPVSMSIVCYRYVQKDRSKEELNSLNQELLILMQEEGIASPSSTVLNGVFCIRVCIVNHRTKNRDLMSLFNASIQFGARLSAAK